MSTTRPFYIIQSHRFSSHHSIHLTPYSNSATSDHVCTLLPLISSHFILSYYLILSLLVLSHLILSHLISSYPISSHAISSHLIPSLTISPLTICTFPSNGTASDHVYPMLPLISCYLISSHLMSSNPFTNDITPYNMHLP